MPNDIDNWISIDDAPERVGRDRATIYRWLADPRVSIRRMRPNRKLWLFLPDLLRVDGEKIRQRGRRRDTPRSSASPQLRQVQK